MWWISIALSVVLSLIIDRIVGAVSLLFTVLATFFFKELLDAPNWNGNKEKDDQS